MLDKGVAAVQTLSRLNRICPPYEKQTFILDFVNDYKDIKEAFAPYYTATLLTNSTRPQDIYDLEAKIDAYLILDPDDIENTNSILYSQTEARGKKKRLTYYIQKAGAAVGRLATDDRADFISHLRRFVRFYDFLLQASCFEDPELHKKYNFITLLLAFMSTSHPGGGYDLNGKIRAIDFEQKNKGEHKTTDMISQPIVKLPQAEGLYSLKEDEEKPLSEIIADINNRAGKNYDQGVTGKSLLQVKDILRKSERLKASAKSNSEKDFELAYFDEADKALVEGLSQNQDFYSLLLSDDDLKRQVLGIFAEDIYKTLRNS